MYGNDCYLSFQGDLWEGISEVCKSVTNIDTVEQDRLLDAVCRLQAKFPVELLTMDYNVP